MHTIDEAQNTVSKNINNELLVPAIFSLLLLGFIGFNLFVFHNNQNQAEDIPKTNNESADVLGETSTWDPNNPGNLTKSDYKNKLEFSSVEIKQELEKKRAGYQNLLDSEFDYSNNIISEFKLEIADLESKLERVNELLENWQADKGLTEPEKLFILSL